MANPRAQIWLWPTPGCSISLADPHTVKVREYLIGFPNPIVINRWPLIGVGFDK